MRNFTFCVSAVVKRYPYNYFASFYFEGQIQSRQSLPAEGHPEKEVVLRDVSGAGRNRGQVYTQNIDFEQEVEIHYLPNNPNSRPIVTLGETNQENIEPARSVRVVNVSDADDKLAQTNELVKPKPITPEGNGGQRGKDPGKSSSDSRNVNQSAFSRMARSKSEKEKKLPGEEELGMYAIKIKQGSNLQFSTTHKVFKNSTCYQNAILC